MSLRRTGEPGRLAMGTVADREHAGNLRQQASIAMGAAGGNPVTALFDRAQVLYGAISTAGSGKCNNPTDCAIKKSDMEGWMPACAQASLGAAAPTATCMVGHGLTQGCADCWGAVAACGAQQCFAACLADSNSAPCRDCSAQNCDPTFNACTGI